jgi:hypothetical protein
VPPSADARAIPTLVARGTDEPADCGSLTLPPSSRLIDPERAGPGGWTLGVADVTGDGAPEIATTAAAYRSVTGDHVFAVFTEVGAGCYAHLGDAYGTIVPERGRYAGWRTQGALLLSVRLATIAPPRDQLLDLRLVNGSLRLRRSRMCFQFEASTGCSPWISENDAILADGPLETPGVVPPRSALVPPP